MGDDDEEKDNFKDEGNGGEREKSDGEIKGEIKSESKSKGKVKKEKGRPVTDRLKDKLTDHSIYKHIDDEEMDKRDEARLRGDHIL